MWLNFFRWLIAFFLLLPFVLKQLPSLIPTIKQRFGWFLAMSATGVAGYHILVYTALGYTTVTNVSLIMGASPATILVISSIMHGERHSKMRMLGVTLCFLGVITLVVGNLTGPGLGDLLACIAMPMWAYYTVSIRNSPDTLSGMSLTVIASFLGLILMLPLLSVELLNRPSIQVSTNLVLAVFYVGVIASGVAYVVWTKGISIIGPSTGAAYMNLVPLFGVLVGVLVLGEVFTERHALAAVFIISGLLISESRKEIY